MAMENDGRRRRGPRAATVARFSGALELYRTTELSAREVCDRAGVPLKGFRNYLENHHRELLFARHGLEMTPQQARSARLRRATGQSAETHRKYRDAINACDDTAYIEYNVSQIAAEFDLNPSALINQLHAHFPEILERREKERRRLGMADNYRRGAKGVTIDRYAGAVEHLRTTDDTIRATAELYGLSYPGLRDHLLRHHRGLVNERASKRKQAKRVRDDR